MKPIFPSDWSLKHSEMRIANILSSMILFILMWLSDEGHFCNILLTVKNKKGADWMKVQDVSRIGRNNADYFKDKIVLIFETFSYLV
jgi:hypothetical protein